MVHFPKGTNPKAGQVLMKDGKPVVLLADHHAHALGEVMLGLKITGQELWQFFGAFGNWGYVGFVLAALLFTVLLLLQVWKSLWKRSMPRAACSSL